VSTGAKTPVRVRPIPLFRLSAQIQQPDGVLRYAVEPGGLTMRRLTDTPLHVEPQLVGQVSA
jgi:hypothetical protein